VGAPNEKARRGFRPGFLQFFPVALPRISLVTMQSKTYNTSRCDRIWYESGGMSGGRHNRLGLWVPGSQANQLSRFACEPGMTLENL